MAFVKRFLRWLSVRPVRGDRYGDSEIAAIDTDRIAEEIDLEGEARRLAGAGLPAADDRELSGTESRIVRRVEKARQEVIGWGADQLKILNQEIERRDLAAILNKAGQADKEFERNASSLLAEREQVLTELAAHARGAAADLESFSSRHHLSRQAAYPETAEVFFRFSLLVLLIVVEGVLNAVFFAKGISTGLVGGFVYAACFAFLNVSFAYLWGRWLLPNLNHRYPLRKLIGAVAVPAAVATALAIALVIAHFRDALSGAVEDAPRTALETFRNHPWELREIQSWGLFGVSVLFALIALADGYGLDDPYPGYGPVTRRRRRAMEAYTLEIDSVRSDLQELKDQALADLGRAAGDAKAVLQALHETIEHKVAVGVRLQTTLADVDNCLDTLLRTFRDLNKLHRRTPCPAYFSERPPLAELRRPDFRVERDRRKYADQCTLMEVFIERQEIIRANIQSSFVRHREGLRPLDTLFDDGEGPGP